MPSLTKTTPPLEIVHRFLLYNENSSAQLNSIDQIKNFLRNCENSKKQTLIKDYFK